MCTECNENYNNGPCTACRIGYTIKETDGKNKCVLIGSKDKDTGECSEGHGKFKDHEGCFGCDSSSCKDCKDSIYICKVCYAEI